MKVQANSFEGIYTCFLKYINATKTESDHSYEQNEEISVEASVLKRIIAEKMNPNSEDGSYGYEDIVRYHAEEIWKRANSFRIKASLVCPMPDDYFYGFLAASKLQSELERYENQR